MWSGCRKSMAEGAHFAVLVAGDGVGKRVSPGDTKGWKEAFVSLAESDAEREAMKSRLSALRERFYWEKVAEPLAGYCRDPYHTRGLSGFRVGFSRFLTSAYRELQLLQRRKAARAFMFVEGSRRAKFGDNGARTHL